MRKILTGLLGIVVLLGAVGGSAYALFSDTAALTGVAMSTGTADLQVSTEVDQSDKADTVDVSSLGLFDGLLPGETTTEDFMLHNEGDTPFVLTAEIPSTPAGNWNALKALISCAIHTTSENAASTDEALSSGFFTLEEWNTLERNIPGDVLDAASSVALNITCGLDSDATEAVAGLGITDMTIQFNGTQETVAE